MTIAPSLDRYLAATHPVINVADELVDVNLYASDQVLQEAVRREQAAWAEADLQRFGALTGSAAYLDWGVQANKFAPELDTHDRFGNRVDLVRFHPAYHQLMDSAIREGLHSAPWEQPRAGAHVARAAKFYLQTQVEAGHLCPITMSFAVVPSLRLQPDVAAAWLPQVLQRQYDPSNRPAQLKSGLTMGMAMTEKQGGSDVRANTTRAHAVGPDGPGQSYELVGHKFFVSAPMCDAFLTLAQTDAGLGCFLMPRWRPDGSKNAMQILRLKRKMGNVSNASSEAELRGALAWMVGEPGRGVRTIIEMVSMTRFDCMVGSSAGMRRASALAIHHCSKRQAFGALLVDQALMQNVLADLALESEAATTLTLRLARALDQRQDPHEDALVRLATAVGKYWICKRTPAHAYEAMECIGGSGVMEDSPFPRLYREAPVNAIWEGSGNVQCLDVLRAIQKTPQVLEYFVAELERARGGSVLLDQAVLRLKAELRQLNDLEYRARHVVDHMAVCLQAALLQQHAPSYVADAFCQSRLASVGQHQYGSLPVGVACRQIIDRHAAVV